MEIDLVEIYNDLSHDFIYVTEKSFIKNLYEKEDKIKYLPLINKYEIDLSKSCNKNLFIYINSYGFYGKSVITKIVEPVINDSNYNMLLKEYKLCKIKNLYFIKIKFTEMIFYKELITVRDYLKYCKKKDIKFVKFPCSLEIFNLFTYDFTNLNKLLYNKNRPEEHDDFLSDELNNILDKKNEGECLSDEFNQIVNVQNSDDDEEEEDEDEEEDDSEEEDNSNQEEYDSEEDDNSNQEDDEENNNKDKEINNELKNNQIKEEYCIPIYWNPCEKLKNVIEKRLKISKHRFMKHYRNCNECEIVNNNEKELSYDYKDICINTVIETEEETEDAIENEEFIDKVIKMYSFSKKFIIEVDKEEKEEKEIKNKEENLIETNKNKKLLIEGDKYLNIIYNKMDNLYKDCFFLIYK